MAEWKFPADINGWLTEEEGRCLADFASGMRVLELGAYAGKSTICMAQTAQELTCIDSFTGTGTPAPRDTYIEFCANLARYGFDRRLTIFRGMFSLCVRQLPRGHFDFALIDGSHDFESVCVDTNNVLDVLKPSGLIGYHDYGSSRDPDVTAAVNTFLAQGAKLLVVQGTVAIVRPATRPGTVLLSEAKRDKAIRELYAALAAAKRGENVGPIGQGDVDCRECFGVGLVGNDGEACACVKYGAVE